MKLSRLVRVSVVGLFMVGLGLTISPGGLKPSTASANTLSTLTVCGPVTSYFASTSFSAGSITVAGVVYGIEPGVTLGNAAVIGSNSNLCLTAAFDASGRIAFGTLTSNSGAVISVCGVVSAYVPPTASAFGSITIAGTTYQIAPGTIITGNPILQLAINPNVCLNASVNLLGQIISGTVTNTTQETINLCGVVSNYIAPTSFALGLVTINGQTISIVAGGFIANSAALVTGANVCLNGSVTTSLEIISASVTSNVAATVVVCGLLTSYTPPTSTTAGSIVIDGQTFGIAAGSTVTGASLATAGANLCLNATESVVGLINNAALSLANSGTASTRVCGVVGAYTAAAAGGAGSIAIGASVLPIAPGATFTGVITIGANICLQAVLNVSGQITGGTVTANVPLAARTARAATAPRGGIRAE